MPPSNERLLILRPIRGNDTDWDDIEAYLKEWFRRTIYYPLLKELDESYGTIRNAADDLYRALSLGKITYHQGIFSGHFNARTSKELRDAGAKWDRKTGTFRLSRVDMDYDLRALISSTADRFERKIKKIDSLLAQKMPENIAGSIQLEKMLDKTLWKTERNFQSTVKGISVTPTLSVEARKKIAKNWEENLSLYVRDFTSEEILSLRKDMKRAVFAGNRYESAVKAIQKSYGVSVNKAKFLARQESKLLITEFQQTRYQEAGITEYTWHSVAGSPAHPVRPRHKALADASKKGRIYRWSEPPVTSEPGEPERRNNPGQDYNCRCYARPVVRFKSGPDEEKIRKRKSAP